MQEMPREEGDEMKTVSFGKRHIIQHFDANGNHVDTIVPDDPSMILWYSAPYHFAVECMHRVKAPRCMSGRAEIFIECLTNACCGD